ncbi:SH3 domain-containing protein [Jiangella ureilytica]|uniref:SH3 domain-containing protein n=1 Tax=Jiangella ureilytica TaxID=2530374 RepID=A0A4R4RVA6_9ACTN|nr:SH3 domain-containing protein [Jiangella ureilytica]TDC53624.1 SH3 domain-containing protein [Jiangella ureilytica]
MGRRRVALLAAPVALAGAVVAGVTLWPDGGSEVAASTTTTLGIPEREQDASRGEERPPLPPVTPNAGPSETTTPTPTPEPTVAGQLFVTSGLNVRTSPDLNAEVVTVLGTGTEVDITGATEGTWSQILLDGEPYWVATEYLSEEKPEEQPSGGISAAECESGSSVEDGLTQDAIRVHRAVCAAFPQVTSYGGLRPGDGGEHGSGRALDIMIRGSVGDQIAAYVRDNYRELGVSEVIWEQRIWTVERASDGWRWMEDRGDDTANHYDHVHVTVYGNEGSS